MLCAKTSKLLCLLCLEKGANPEFKDYQLLSAIDHAALMHNETMLATILSVKIGQELQQVKEQIKCQGSSAHVNNLKDSIQKKFTVNPLSLSLTPRNQAAAYQGNLEGLNDLTAQYVNRCDDKGWTPLHYAILGNQIEAARKLLQIGADVHLVDKDKDSLLHFASAQGSKPMIQLLLDAGIDRNKQNSSGATALHYAAAKENLGAIELLVKNGANPHLLDSKGMSALALIGTSAYQRDPLALPMVHFLMFATSSLAWLSYAAMTRRWISEKHLETMTVCSYGNFLCC